MKKRNYRQKLYKNPKNPFKRYKKIGLPGLLTILAIMLVVYFTTDDRNDIIHTNDRNVVNSFEKYKVKLDRHIDGDTTKFIFNGESHSFRYLLIDTPEIDRSGKEHDPYAIAALKRVEELLDNATHIYIEFDNELQDKYDRFLVYVYADDIFVNELLVREGLAKVRYIYPPNDTYVNVLKQAEEKAKAAKIGLWSL